MIVGTGVKPLLLILLALAAGSLRGQLRVDSSSEDGQKLPARFEEQWRRKDLGSLKCSVTPYHPALDYGLRMWSGYGARVPASEFKFTQGELAAVVLRVVPEANPAGASHFWQRVNIPRLPAGVTDPRKAELTMGGGYFLGEGRYRVDWMMLHSDGRVCKASWKLTAKGKDLPTRPDTVESLEAVIWRGFPKRNDGKEARATIFVNAAPVWPRRYVSRLSPWDRQILLSTLNSLLSSGRFTSARVVVFDLQRRKVIYREPEFDARALMRLARQLMAVDLSTISMQTLQDPTSPREFLEEMMRAELKEGPQSDAVVFIGTRWRAGPKLQGLSADVKEWMPQTWFLGFTTPQLAGDQDSVSSLVRAVRGKVFNIYRPADLAEGIREISGTR